MLQFLRSSDLSGRIGAAQPAAGTLSSLECEHDHRKHHNHEKPGPDATARLRGPVAQSGAWHLDRIPYVVLSDIEREAGRANRDPELQGTRGWICGNGSPIAQIAFLESYISRARLLVPRRSSQLRISPQLDIQLSRPRLRLAPAALHLGIWDSAPTATLHTKQNVDQAHLCLSS